MFAAKTLCIHDACAWPYLCNNYPLTLMIALSGSWKLHLSSRELSMVGWFIKQLNPPNMAIFTPCFSTCFPTYIIRIAKLSQGCQVKRSAKPNAKLGDEQARGQCLSHPHNFSKNAFVTWGNVIEIKLRRILLSRSVPSKGDIDRVSVGFQKPILNCLEPVIIHKIEHHNSISTKMYVCSTYLHIHQ